MMIADRSLTVRDVHSRYFRDEDIALHCLIRSSRRVDTMKRTYTRAALCVGWLISSAFHLTAKQVPEKPEPDRCTVEGIVMDHRTGRPLVGVRVQGSGMGGGVVTDGRGRFRVEGLLPGRKTLMAIPQDGSFAPKTRQIHVLPGTGALFVEFRLQRSPVLSGRIVDRDGRPVGGVKVVARTFKYMNGRKRFGYASTETNDQGEYTVSLLAGGRAVVSAEPQKLTVRRLPAKLAGTTAGQPQAERSAASGHVTTYYPSSRSLSDAMPIDVRPGENRENIDIRLMRDRTVCISSAVQAETGLLGGVPVTVALAEAIPSNMSRLTSAELSLGDRFEICGISDGNYRLFASATNADGDGLYGEVTFDVNGREATIPPVRIKAPRPVTGKVVVDAEDKNIPIPTGLQIQLEAKDRGDTPVLTVTRTKVEASGDFVIPLVTEGDYWLNTYGLSDGLYVKWATVDGMDASRQPLHIGLGMGDIRVVLRDDGASISGRVLDEKERPVDQATVHLVVSSVPSLFAQSEWQTTVADADGQFSFSSVVPGSYLLLAVGDELDAASLSPQALTQLRSGATAIKVSALESKQVVLRPLPPDRISK